MRADAQFGTQGSQRSRLLCILRPCRPARKRHLPFNSKGPPHFVTPHPPSPRLLPQAPREAPSELDIIYLSAGLKGTSLKQRYYTIFDILRHI